MAREEGEGEVTGVLGMPLTWPLECWKKCLDGAV